MVIAIITLNTVAWVASNAVQEKVLLQHYGFIPAAPLSLSIITSMFLHAGFWHWAGNMLFLWMFGNQIEDSFGRSKFLIIYIVCGLGATLAHWLSDPASTIPCIGASGAISGIVGAYFVLYPRNPFDLHLFFGWWKIHSWSTTARVAVGVWFLEQFLLGLLSRVSHFSAVAFWAHIGGFVTGCSIAFAYAVLVPEEERLGNLTDVDDGAVIHLDLNTQSKGRARGKRAGH